MTHSHFCHVLDREQCGILAEALGDTPQTVISVHLLRRGLCRACAAGDPSRFTAAVVQSRFSPTEPTGFSSDPEILWQLLQSVEGCWDCIDVPSEVALALGKIIKEKMDVGVRYVDDVYYTLKKPAPHFCAPEVRRITLDDLYMFERAPRELQGVGFESPRALLTEGIAAGAVVSDTLVSIAYTTALSDRHADIGVHTLEPWRRRGYAAAGASIVAAAVQSCGVIPVWSAGENNPASNALAKKLAFAEVGRTTYVMVDKAE